MPMSEKITDANLKVLGQIIEAKFSTLEDKIGALEDKIREQRVDFKENLMKTDRNIEKLEVRVSQNLGKLEEETKKIANKLEVKSDDLTKLQSESSSVLKQWGAFVGLIAGAISSVVVSLLVRYFGE